MQESIGIFLSFVKMMTGSVMSDATHNIYYYAIGLTVFMLAIKVTIHRGGRFFPKFLGAPFMGTRAKRQQIVLSALKTCPECAEQLPLSTLVCDTCNYNFLSGSVAHRHKLLPPPVVATSTG